MLRGMFSCPVQESKNYFTALFSALPAVNFGTFLAGILISLPVWGVPADPGFALAHAERPKAD